MMPILVESDDVRSGRKAKDRHGPLWRLGSQWVKMPAFKEKVKAVVVDEAHLVVDWFVHFVNVLG